MKDPPGDTVPTVGEENRDNLRGSYWQLLLDCFHPRAKGRGGASAGDPDAVAASTQICAGPPYAACWPLAADLRRKAVGKVGSALREVQQVLALSGPREATRA